MTTLAPGLCQFAVTGRDSKFDLQLLSQCGSTYNDLSRFVPEIHQHVAETLSNQLTTTAGSFAQEIFKKKSAPLEQDTYIEENSLYPRLLCTFLKKVNSAELPIHASSTLVCQFLLVAHLIETSTTKSVFYRYRSPRMHISSVSCGWR